MHLTDRRVINMKILLNGVEPEDEDLKRILKSEALNFGYSIFETVKVKNSGFGFLREHLDRLNSSFKLLGIDEKLEFEDIERICRRTVEINEFEDGALKILAAKTGKGIDTVVSLRKADYPEEKYEKGFRLLISEVRRNEKSVMPKVKSSNYLDNIFEKRKAAEKGYDDILFLNTEGKVAETAIANIFFLKDGNLFTPDTDSGILNGIVREKILEIAENTGIKTEEGKFSLEDLKNADEVFLTNSLMGVMPVSEIAGREYDFKDITGIRKKYEEILNEEIQR